MKSIYDWAQRVCKVWEKEFLFVHGKAGTGKTHLACSVAKHIRLNGNTGHKRCGYVNASDMFFKLRNTYNESSKRTESDLIEKYRQNIPAVFDDIGIQGKKEYVLEAWYNIIDYRYSQCIPTLFTSNLSLDEISGQMSDRIASRLASGKVIELAGEDRRIVK